MSEVRNTVPAASHIFTHNSRNDTISGAFKYDIQPRRMEILTFVKNMSIIEVMHTKTRPIRVGFDLDGVILYNPLRIARPIIACTKMLLFHRKKVTFYVPQKPWEQWLFRLFHKSSIFVAPGFEEIKKMAQNHSIEAYIITARYGFLRPDFEQWLRAINAKDYFVAWYLNSNNQQPHIFKKECIEKLKLDVFVEDNWDIVSYLQKHTKAHIVWITNVFDRSIPYTNKFSSLKDILPVLSRFKGK